jgi:hypothetical protein
VLTRDDALAKLLIVGLSREDAEVTLSTAEREMIARLPRVSVGLLIDAARNNLISIQQLQSALGDRGYSPDDIRIITLIASQQKELGLTADHILSAFSVRVIDRDAAYRRLVALGYEPADANLRLDTVEKKAELTKPTASVGLLMGLASEGLITSADLRRMLKERDYSEEDILLITAATEYKPPTPLSQSTVVRAFKSGVLNRDDALNRLLVLGLTPGDAQVVLNTAEKEMNITQAKPSVTTYVAATRDGILTPQELREKLLRLGMLPEDVDIFVQLAVFKPAEAAKKLTKAEILKAYEAFMFDRVDALRRLETLGYALEDADILIRMVRRDPQDSEVHALYQARILTDQQAAISLAALGYTDEQIEYYFEHFAVVK